MQALEDDHARPAGRQPCKVAPVEMAELGRCGEMDPSTWTIRINVAHIQQDALEFSAIHTVLHEGRHAYQRAAIESEGLHPDREQVRVWKQNSAVYVSNSEKNFLIYRFQPIERDANAHAGTEIKRIFERLEQTYGPIESCQRYSVMLTAEARFVAAKAREKYGDDFEVKIDEAMHKAYEIIHGVEAKKAYRISVQFEGRGWVEKVVSTAAAGKEELRQKLADEARRFALKEAMRLGMPPEGVNGAQTKIDTVPMERQQTKERSVERGRGVG